MKSARVSPGSGTQAIGRAATLLRQIATRGRLGLGLNELARRTQIDKGTAHRILAGLVRERLVEQRPSNRRYITGPLLFELALANPMFLELQQKAAQPLERIAARFRLSSSLHLRSGFDAVCAWVAGRPPYRGASIVLGRRRPLIATSAGVAILIALPREEALAIAKTNLRSVDGAGAADRQALMRMLERSMGLGYAVNDNNVVPGIGGISVPLLDAGNAPFASISVAGPSDEIRPKTAGILEALRQESPIIESEARRLFAEIA